MVRAIDLMKFCEKVMKSLSKVGVKTSDCQHIGMYNEYKELERQGVKKEYIRAVLSGRYHISESTIYRIVTRLDKQVKI